MGGCQKYGPFLGTLHIRGRMIIGIQKGTIVLTTTHVILTAAGVPLLCNKPGRSNTHSVHEEKTARPEKLQGSEKE